MKFEKAGNGPEIYVGIIRKRKYDRGYLATIVVFAAENNTKKGRMIAWEVPFRRGDVYSMSGLEQVCGRIGRQVNTRVVGSLVESRNDMCSAPGSDVRPATRARRMQCKGPLTSWVEGGKSPQLGELPTSTPHRDYRLARAEDCCESRPRV